MGATVTVAPLASLGMTGSSGLDPVRLVAGINHSRPQSLILVPELAMALVAAAQQGQLDRGRAAGLPLYEGYGLSECSSVVALNVSDDECQGTVGRPLLHVEVMVNPDHHILVRGNTHLGYLGDEPEGDGGCEKWLESELIQALGAQQAVIFGDGDPKPSALVVIRDGRSPAQLRSALTAINAGLPDYARVGALYIRREHLTGADGYLTTNGRPVRHRIQADLPTLLAGAFPIFTSTISTKQPGESHMAFFDRLQQETAEAREHVTGAPVVSAIADGRFSLEAYTWFLTQAYHHVRHTVPLMKPSATCIPTVPWTRNTSNFSAI
jgi:acyl-CoA synthetase (AMP-forming)/AMP-acid ligase II